MLEGKEQEQSKAETEATTSNTADKTEIVNGDMPILDCPNFDVALFLIGSMLTIWYYSLIPSQKRSLKLVREHHLKVAGEAGGVLAAPFIAIIDGYTAAATKAS